MRKSIYVLLDLETAMENAELERIVTKVLEKHIALTWDNISVTVMPRLLSSFEMDKLHSYMIETTNLANGLRRGLKKDLETRTKLNFELQSLFKGVEEAEKQLLELIKEKNLQQLKKGIHELKETVESLQKFLSPLNLESIQKFLKKKPKETKEP